MNVAVLVLRFIIGGYAYLVGIFGIIYVLTQPQWAHAVLALGWLVLGWAVFPIKPKLLTYDAKTDEDPETKS
ncbi:MAG: hypothetical protein ACHQY2_07175 [Candidatus Eremiobacterales bacterium]|jgi:hypothetical protein